MYAIISTPSASQPELLLAPLPYIHYNHWHCDVSPARAQLFRSLLTDMREEKIASCRLNTLLIMAAAVGPRPNPTSSWWLANAPSVATAAVPPASCDLAIIGAGMTGCAVAHWTRVLDAAGGGSVVLLDARGVAGGAF